MTHSHDPQHYSAEDLARAVRAVLACRSRHASPEAAIAAVAAGLGCVPRLLTVWVRLPVRRNWSRDGGRSPYAIAKRS